MNGSSADECDAPVYPTGEKNPVSALQELCQTDFKSKIMPVYEEKGLVNSFFTVSCSVGDFYTMGKDPTKKGAKTEAAIHMFRLLMSRKTESPDDKVDLAPVPPTPEINNTFLPILDVSEQSDEEELSQSLDQVSLEEAPAAVVTVKEEIELSTAIDKLALEEAPAADATVPKATDVVIKQEQDSVPSYQPNQQKPPICETLAMWALNKP